MDRVKYTLTISPENAGILLVAAMKLDAIVENIGLEEVIPYDKNVPKQARLPKPRKPKKHRNPAAKEIEDSVCVLLAKAPEGMAGGAIRDALPKVKRNTMQYYLKSLQEQNRITYSGGGKQRGIYRIV